MLWILTEAYQKEHKKIVTSHGFWMGFLNSVLSIFWTNSVHIHFVHGSTLSRSSANPNKTLSILLTVLCILYERLCFKRLHLKCVSEDDLTLCEKLNIGKSVERHHYRLTECEQFSEVVLGPSKSIKMAFVAGFRDQKNQIELLKIFS